MPLGAVIGGLLGAGLSFWQEYERRQQEEELIAERKRMLEQAKIDENERLAMEASLNRAYNTQGINQANAMAYGLSGVLNEDTLRGLQSSALMGRRASDMLRLDQYIRNTNRRIDMQLANVFAPSPIDAGNILASGFLGGKIGNELEELFK